MPSKIKFLGDFSRINDEEMGFVNKKLKNFTDKYESNFSEMYIKLDCHVHRETSRGRPAYYCKVGLTSDKGKFNAEQQDFGAEKTISGALDKIERQIHKKKGH